MVSTVQLRVDVSIDISRIQTKESTARVEQFGSMITDVLDVVERIERQNNKDRAAEGLSSNPAATEALPKKVVEVLNDNDIDVGVRVYRELVQELWTSAHSPKAEATKFAGDNAPSIQDAITRGLVSGVFDEIGKREKLITDAYESTFSWVFRRTPVIEAGEYLWSSFPKWLEGDDKSVFWITGKPGSGKSTLMKFILSSNELRRFLEKWAGGFPLHVTSFYAWIAGSDLQKSHLGLMRTVLHQCLQSHPGLASAVAPRRWALFSTLRSYEKQPPWEEWELKESFEYLLSEIVKTHRLAFFIDGLDEFEVSPTQTLALVKEIGARDGIKVCVASRQWREFNDELGTYPVLRMQDLTEGDMMRFVRGTFSLNIGFQEQMQIFADEVESIVLEIVNKSSGVFLWSHLVVKDLSEAFTDGEGLFRLKEILRSLPEDLKDLYTNIWRRMGHRRSSFARLMALFRASEGPLHLLNLWLADGGPQGLTGLDLSVLSVLHLSAIRSQVIRRLDSHTRGILELSKDDIVELLHRTTLDWVKGEEIWSDISSHLDPQFDPLIELIEAEGLLTRWRLAHPDVPGLQHDPERPSKQRIYEVLRYANKVKSSLPNTQRLVQILDEFDKDMADLLSCPRGGVMDKKPHNTDWAYYQGSGCNFLGLAVRYCAVIYVDSKLAARPQLLQASEIQRRSLLDNAIFGHYYNYTEDAGCVPITARIRMVALLLDRGASVGQLPPIRRDYVRTRASRAGDTEDERRDHKYWKEVDRLLSERESALSAREERFARGRFRLLLTLLPCIGHQ